ncbi:pantoate--beta-alanine ligase [Pelagivirga sediminicola]|uniref:Pantothenate synthetase n=1 Tax=Pelagivirga sediminicola TaxID=2170575 RepID=A0A2T7G4E7_9RHOB|nr:pantoate--beta-alanine ligase [Pelagivirga sediminicola]PVA09299.1 pantoate--beta-alanine ligase [Pelagivirga sediminicola]
MSAPIVRNLADLRAAILPWRDAGARIGVVPTMGALHDGHLSLARAAKRVCDRVIVTIFVNPRQFSTPEDVARYPRTEQADAARLARHGVDAIYVPDVDQIYPDGFATTVTVSGLTEVMDGIHRPGHFAGVTTVVAKLLAQTSATDAFFGEKDFQQLQVVRRMVRDLDMPVTIHGCPTIREIDGLAMSSRNLLLSDRARTIAPALVEQMEQMAAAIVSGRPAEEAQRAAIAALKQAGFTDVDYIEMRANDDLSLLTTPSRPARLFAAAWLAGVRLIDNIAVER